MKFGFIYNISGDIAYNHRWTMIRFPCHCGHEFELPEDSAGGTIQCPHCGRLNDVPTLSDLANLTSDGTFKINQPAASIEADRMAQLRRAFARRRNDDSGNPIDLRPTLDEVDQIGAEEIPLSLADQVRPGAPKYNPETGELVRPLNVRPMDRPDESTIPMAGRAIGYSSGDLAARYSPVRILIELLLPMNLVVMLFVLLAHVVAQFALYIIFGWVVSLLIAGLIMAHYATVVEEIGPEDRDELPRPLRNVSIGDDLWRPFCHFFLSLAVCYWPMVTAWYLGVTKGEAILVSLIPALFGLGGFLFPAVLLTMTTSGAPLANLRPDRIWSIIRQSGGGYLASVIFCLPASGLYLWLLVGLDLLPRQWMAANPWMMYLNHFVVVYLLIWIAIYLTHFFAWHLGLLYRRHHDQFNWTLQRHTPVNRMANLPQEVAQRRAEAAKRTAP